MTKIELQLQKAQKRLAKLKVKKREQDLKRKQRLNPKPSGKRGRPRVDELLIIKAIQMAEKLPLSDVALRLNVSRRTLNNYGLTRRALEEKFSI
jgi:transcriptional regulator GlxA family with amidase domain